MLRPCRSQLALLSVAFAAVPFLIRFRSVLLCSQSPTYTYTPGARIQNVLLAISMLDSNEFGAFLLNCLSRASMSLTLEAYFEN